MDLFNPTLFASFHSGRLEGRGRGSRPSPSLPAPGSRPRSHLTRIQVAGRREGRGLCARGGSRLEPGALSCLAPCALHSEPGAPCHNSRSWQINESTNTNSRCAGEKRPHRHRRRERWAGEAGRSQRSQREYNPRAEPGSSELTLMKPMEALRPPRRSPSCWHRGRAGQRLEAPFPRSTHRSTSPHTQGGPFSRGPEGKHGSCRSLEIEGASL